MGVENGFEPTHFLRIQPENSDPGSVKYVIGSSVKYVRLAQGDGHFGLGACGRICEIAVRSPVIVGFVAGAPRGRRQALSCVEIIDGAAAIDAPCAVCRGGAIGEVN